MKLTFLGSSAAFESIADNYQSNLLLESSGQKKLLIDCGSDARRSLHAVGLSCKDITHVYISHLHADHIGGLEWLGFSRYFDPDCERPHLYLHEDLLHPLWNNSLSGGMNCLEGGDSPLSTFFNHHPLTTTFTWEGLKLQLVQTKHAYQEKKQLPCHGLFFKYNNKNIYFTCDTQFCPDFLKKYYESADLIFHDCDTSNTKKSIHSSYADLVTLPSKVKAKIWLYHYTNTNDLAKQDGFRGFVKKGQTFDLDDLE